MRILYFSREYTPHDYRFLEGLSGRNVVVGALFLSTSTNPLEERPLPPGVTRLAWPGGERPLDAANIPALVEDLKIVAERFQPDLVHAGPIPGPAYLAALAGCRPLVSMSWGSDLLVEAVSSPEKQEITRFTLAHSDAMLGDCEAVARAASGFGFPRQRMVLFPWGVDLDLYSPGPVSSLRRQLGWEDCFVLLSTRGWEPLLGVDVLVEGFRRSAAQNQGLRLILLGSGSLESQIHRILSHQAVQGKVHFAGRVPEPAMRDYYRAADLYACASHSDGSSVSLMQALACSLPALVSDIPGNREWVENGVEGWLFEDGNAGELAEKIMIAAKAGPALQDMRIASRRQAEKRADWQKNFARIFEAYAIAESQAAHES